MTLLLIVIDTTETFKEPYLTGPDWTLVEAFLLRHPATLVVPEIVVEEAVNHFRDKLRDALNESRRSLGKLRKLLPSQFGAEVPVLDADASTNDYRTRLSERLSSLRALRPSYEQINVMNVVRRSLSGRKPFDAKGQRGFRDAVLWETVLALLQESDEKAFLVTENVSDFGEHGSLAPDLCEDLASRGIPTDRIVVCTGIHIFADEYVKPELSKLEGIQRQLQEHSFHTFDIEGFFADAFYHISSAIEDCVRRWDFQELGYITRRFFDSPRLENLKETPTEVVVGDVYRVSEGSITFSLTYEIDGRISCEERHDYSPDDRPWTTEFVGSARFTVQTSIVLEAETGQVTEFTVDDVQLRTGFDWPYDETD